MRSLVLTLLELGVLWNVLGGGLLVTTGDACLFDSSVVKGVENVVAPIEPRANRFMSSSSEAVSLFVDEDIVECLYPVNAPSVLQFEKIGAGEYFAYTARVLRLRFG